MTTRSGSDAPIKPSKSRTDTGPNFVVGEIIVKMKPTKTLSPQVMSALEIEKGAQQPLSGGEILVRINPTTFHSLNASDAAKKTIEALKQLRKDPNVEYAQLNYIVVAQQVNRMIRDTTNNGTTLIKEIRQEMWKGESASRLYGDNYR